MNLFGENLRLLREKKGISQAELARRIGVSRSVISNYEAGKRSQISTPYIVAIAAALDVPWQELVAGTDLQGQAACAIDGYTSIKTVNGKTYFNGVEITTGSDPHKQAHIELLHRQVEQLDDDTLRNLSKVADEMRQLPVSAQEEIVRFSKFRRKEMESNR